MNPDLLSQLRDIHTACTRIVVAAGTGLVGVGPFAPGIADLVGSTSWWRATGFINAAGRCWVGLIT